MLAQLRVLHGYCAPPGRTLTQKGSPRVADSRELVGRLGTDDVLDETVRAVKSVDDLPGVAWLVRVAIAARAVRRQKGRLVAVAAWDEVGPVEALDRVVDAAVEVGLGGPGGHLDVFTEWAVAIGQGGLSRRGADRSPGAVGHPHAVGRRRRRRHAPDTCQSGG